MKNLGESTEQDIKYMFAKAFTKYTNKPSILNINKCTWPGIKRKTKIKNSYFTDSIFPILTKPSNILYKDINKYLSDMSSLAYNLNVDVISFDGLHKNDITEFNIKNKWVTKQVIAFYNDLEKWSFSSKIKCANRRSIKRGVYLEIAKTAEDFYDLRKTLDYLPFEYYDSPEEIKSQVEFFLDAYLNNKGIGLLAKYNDEVIGGMFGLLVENTMYMLIHGYKIEMVSLYMNDFLYTNFIKICLEKGVKTIFWGNADLSDLGLIRMKKKYSNLIMEEFSVHWVGNIVK